MSDETDWYGPEAATFGDRLAAAREAADMTQAQLARRLGVKKSTISGWENDLSEPRANRLSMLAGLLNVSIVWLITGEGQGGEALTETDETARDMAALLTELRSLRADLQASGQRAARLEKQLRQIMEQTE
ncbi:helix-turn-helix transcriptional regulator [Ruegeria pomeroyi]|uniref:Helix-turn-helix transcriptional regulator n=2 Tax=Ruegeria TaxID=97050 RepID=A0A9Q3WEJ2_9RHOB|nr:MULTISPECIES: helix-turn-helix transcriptional regulator [Ruegeria]MCE8510301.1 helix-turn-helix transcriptional regulator [Ruegeria pomeroyi]MCE8513597.1 helix-turn-helix transcriptional regulator [Ruegeria pomeroyi]MCE8517907.1 helix-turn-helix transcriptional regulator [Ruegeria pomeroyi]MCE8521240.1 helix-turn-helix transcriptional regulator [Ruegeria pomeroyi]MCE8525826.1 helix-turn-helix transcriptional regulator [Ruegeria pomeroyi]